jgi:PAS domain S-box-containing protein
MTSDGLPPGSDPAEIELRNLRSLVADARAIVWEADARTLAFSFVSEGTASILGFSPNEWLDDPSFWTDHLHADDRERTISRLVRASMSGSRFDAEYRFIAKDGSVVWLRDVGHTVNDPHGQPAVIRGVMTDITARKTLETTPSEAEERFRRIAENLPAIVYLEQVPADPTQLGRMLYVSPAVERILGFSPQEWTEDPMSWMRHFHPDDTAGLHAAYQRAARTGEPLSAEYRMYGRDGRVVWFHDQAVLVRDVQGQPSYWQGIMYDVTEQREMTASMSEIEARYKALLEQLPAIVYSEDAAGERLRFVYVNSRVERTLGVSPQEWMLDPRVWTDSVHPEDRDAVHQAKLRAASSGEPFQSEYRMLARDGHTVWVRDGSTLVQGAPGRPAHRHGVMLDITKTKEAEARLEDAQERLQQASGDSPTITYIDALDGGTTLFISPQTTDVLGYTPADWYADPGLWAKIVHPDDRDQDRVVTTEGPIDSVYRVRTADGRMIWVHDRARVVTDADATPKYWQGTLVDVTAQRRTQQLERDLERERDTADQLRASDEMKNTFLQAVSHDLRTPLAAILGLAVTLARADLFLGAEESRDIADRIVYNARKLDGIVSDLLDLDRMTSGIVEPDFTELDVANVVRELIGSSEFMVGRHLDLDANQASIWADEAMVERIVENLIVNAVKHTPKDSRIWVRVEPEGSGVLMVVEDDGPGVPIEERKDIFEAFRRGEMGPSTAGAGIGLTLVARFAELHGGRVWVEDRIGGGASFRVFLPGNFPEGPVDANDDQREIAGSSEASQA